MSEHTRRTFLGSAVAVSMVIPAIARRVEGRQVRLVTRRGGGRDAEPWQRFATQTAVIDSKTGEDISNMVPFEYGRELIDQDDVTVEAFDLPVRVGPDGEVVRTTMRLLVVERMVS